MRHNERTDGSNIQESYPGIVSPLTFSFIRRAYEEVYKSFLRMMGVSEAVIRGQGDLFTNMLAYVDGRVYYNLGSWYRLIALLPAYKTNRTFMEGMMGLKDSASELAEFADSRKTSLSDHLATLASAMCIVKNYLTLPTQIKDFNQRLQSVLEPSSADKSLSALYKHYRHLEANLLGHWQAPICNDFFAMIFFGLFSRLSGACDEGNDRGYLYNLLLSNHGGIISAEPPKRIAEIASLIAAGNDEQLIVALIQKDVPTALRLLKANGPAYGLYLEYLDKFADRAIGELKLEARSLRDDPGLLLATIGNLAGKIRSGDYTQNSPDSELNYMGQAIKKSNPVTGLLARLARQSLAQRENLRFARTRVFGEVRRIVLAMAEHLVEMRVLAEKRDVFYLTIEELLGFIDGTAVSTNLAALVVVRKEEAAKYHGAAAERLSVYGAVGLRQDCPAVVEECQLKGLGASAGKVRGLARVIADPDNETVAPGEILVADHTDPGWIFHFATCSAIVVAHGSQLSHTAIVAREMNLPAVVACRGVMGRIKSGDLIEVDGSQGLITVLKERTESVSVINGEKVDVEATA